MFAFNFDQIFVKMPFFSPRFHEWMEMHFLNYTEQKHNILNVLFFEGYHSTYALLVTTIEKLRSCINPRRVNIRRYNISSPSKSVRIFFLKNKVRFQDYHSRVKKVQWLRCTFFLKSTDTKRLIKSLNIIFATFYIFFENFNLVEFKEMIRNWFVKQLKRHWTPNAIFNLFFENFSG